MASARSSNSTCVWRNSKPLVCWTRRGDRGPVLHGAFPPTPIVQSYCNLSALLTLRRCCASRQAVSCLLSGRRATGAGHLCGPGGGQNWQEAATKGRPHRPSSAWLKLVSDGVQSVSTAVFPDRWVCRRCRTLADHRKHDSC